MKFEKTTGSIFSLKDQSSISVDEMLGIVVCVVADCYKSLGINDVTNMSINDSRRMVLNLSAVASMLISAAENNSNVFNEVKSSNTIEKTINQLNVVNTEYTEVSQNIEKEKKIEDELTKKKNELEEANKEYMRIQKECESLQIQINQLSNTNLDQIKGKRDNLSSDLKKRQNEKAKLDNEIDGLKGSLSTVNTDIQTCKRQKKELNKNIATAEREKISWENKIEKLQKDLDEIKKWNNEFPKIFKKMKDDSDSHETMMAQLRTSMNGIFSDEFLKDHLFSNTGYKAALSPTKYPDLDVVADTIHKVEDLENWSDKMMKRIQGLLNIYQEELRRIEKCSKTIYAKDDDNK